MKKTYIQPALAIVETSGVLMGNATSVENANNDVQKPIEDNDDDEFEAGAKGSGFGDLWED